MDGNAAEYCIGAQLLSLVQAITKRLLQAPNTAVAEQRIIMPQTFRQMVHFVGRVTDHLLKKLAPRSGGFDLTYQVYAVSCGRCSIVSIVPVLSLSRSACTCEKHIVMLHAISLLIFEIGEETGGWGLSHLVLRDPTKSIAERNAHPSSKSRSIQLLR